MNRLFTSSALVAFTLIIAGCEAEIIEEPLIRPVRAIQVSYGGSDLARTYSGAAQTDRIIDLSFRSGGIINLLSISVGQEVGRGELLAQINNVEARLAQEQAVSALNSAASEKNTAELNLDRVRRLYESGTASLSEYETAKNSFRTAEASFKSAERSVDIQEEQVRYGEIYSPQDGRISAIHQELNENVGAGETVAVLNAGENMEVEVGLPESVINSIKLNTRATIILPSLTGETYEGLVTEISPSLDEQTTTYPVTVTITNPSQRIRSGMAANVTFQLDDNRDIPKELIVPAQSVGEDVNGRFVFVLEKDGDSIALAKKRTVVVGTLSTNGFRIIEGLQEGEWIATAGVHTLIDGQTVLHKQ